MAESATITEITQMLTDLSLCIRHANKLIAASAATSTVNVIGAELEKQIDQIGSGVASDPRRDYLQALLSEGNEEISDVNGMITGLVNAMEDYCMNEVKPVVGSTYGVVKDVVGISLATAMLACGNPATTIKANTTAITGIASGGSNSGDGMLFASGTTQMCTGDDWRVECQGGDNWTVTGGTHGRLNSNAQTNEKFTDADAGISFKVASGTAPFAADDAFFFTSTSDDAGVIQSGLRDRLGTVLPASGAPVIPDSIAT